ncbi:MAG TPA: response regulator [bacterium]|nr:response regulator [bacterium]
MHDAAQRGTILIVDDSPDTLELIRRNLELARYAVLTASSVNEAKGLLEHQKFDLCITDYHMPFASGIDLIRFVRGTYPGTAIIMITGYASVEGAVEAIKAGAEEYLSKPFTDDELLTLVDKIFEQRRDRKDTGTGTPVS